AALLGVRARKDAAAGPGRRAMLLSAGAGLVAGFAIITKGGNLILLPPLLAPVAPAGPSLARTRRPRLWGAPTARAALSFGLWLAFELARFGRPFSSYGKNQRFDHPLLDGLWRLTVGPNKGLLLFFPLLLLSVVGVVRLARERATWGPAVAIGGTSL